MDDIIQSIAIYAIPSFLPSRLHEAAHGYVARMFGDPTAYQMGRVSLNPPGISIRSAPCWCRLVILLASKLMRQPGHPVRLGQARSRGFRPAAPA